MDVVRQILEKWELIALVVAVNAFLGGAAQLFRWISKKTKATWDDKVAAYLGKGSDFLAKVLDWLNGNLEHKPEDKKEKESG